MERSIPMWKPQQRCGNCKWSGYFQVIGMNHEDPTYLAYRDADPTTSFDFVGVCRLHAIKVLASWDPLTLQCFESGCKDWDKTGVPVAR